MADSTGANNLTKADMTLQLAYWRALEMAEFKGGFLARTAHELRSPLNKVISLQQMILEGLCDDVDEEREFIAEAQAAAMKLLEYLDFLIRVAKIETGRVKPQIQAVSLAQIFAQVEEMTHLQASDRNLKLLIEPPPASLQVQTDPTWLCNGLTTLIDIAIHSCQNGFIRLHVAPAATLETCRIWLEDERPAEFWQESTTLPILSPFDLDDTLSASLRMGMVEAMLTAMHSRLALLSTPAADNPLTRQQIELPLVQ